MIERRKDAGFGEAEGWKVVCVTDAAPSPEDDDADIIDEWLATVTEREFERILVSFLT